MCYKKCTMDAVTLSVVKRLARLFYIKIHEKLKYNAGLSQKFLHVNAIEKYELFNGYSEYHLLL